MKTGWNLSVFLSLTVLTLCGCGTVITRTNGDAGPYHGYRHDMEKVSNADEWLDVSVQGSAGDVPIPGSRGLLWLLDAPFSLVADTLLLPADALSAKKREKSMLCEAGQPVDGGQPSTGRAVSRDK